MEEFDHVAPFLNRFAEAVMNNQLDVAINYCVIPNIIVGGKFERVINSIEELSSVFAKLNGALVNKNVSHVVPIIKQVMCLSDSVFFTNIRWQLMNQHKDIIASWASSYTLKKMEDGEFKIIVTVVDDDNKQLEQILLTD